ncbi:hypothetical protein [Mucilaginibacter glaciei]|uniref:hypothetical protein n=1 Tax=Mucilaginibacter glaciei TaxID=2772109 RepID=UPI001CD0BA03|nr:hypothetical protein [Mucilaginibacter glaciei]
MHKVFLAAISLIAIALGVAVYITPAALFPDPSWGFQVMRSMEFGGGFNMLVKPDAADISKNTADFLTWWSPGQYLLPYLFKIVFGLNTGKAMAVVTTLCTVTGLLGLYAFFKKAGFTPMISALSLLFIICQQAFFSPYIFYNGGEVLLFAFFGWFLYGCMAFDKPGLKLAIFVLLAGWLGFICKSSFIWMYAAGLLFMWIRMSEGQRTVKSWVLKGLWPGVPAVISVACIYLFYLSKGSNPSSESGGLKLAWETFSFPLASPLLSGFSADDLFNGLIYHNDAVLFSHQWAVIIVLLLAILSVILVRYILTKVPYQNYRLMLLVVYAVSVVFFGVAYLRQMAISYEARHFRLIGLLVTPGLVHLFWHAGRVYQITLGAVALLIAFFSVSFYIEGYQRLHHENPHGPSGIAQQFIDKEALDYITRLDQTHSNALFVFTSPDLGLEIMHNRFITLQPLNGDISINFDEYVHKGHSGPLYILLPSKYIGVRASVFLKCFPGYKAFTLKEVSDEYVVYSSNTYR